MNRFLIGLGSNLGDRVATLRSAVEELAVVGKVEAVSSLYRSAPIGPDQPEFLNAAVVLETRLEPDAVLDAFDLIEFEAGRRRLQPSGPRTLDLDILAGPEERVSERLTMPHERWAERRFVVEPVMEIWEAAAPMAGIDFGLLTAAHIATADQDVERLVDPDWVTETGKGTGWVAIQVIMFALVIGAAVFVRDSMPAWVRWAGGVFVIAGTVLGLAGMRGLGRNLTAFPEPVKYGELTEQGVYAIVRHPIYGANVLLLSGVALVGRSWPAVVAAVGAAGFFWIKAGAEEIRLTLRYGGYAGYRQRVPQRLLPWIL